MLFRATTYRPTFSSPSNILAQYYSGQPLIITTRRRRVVPGLGRGGLELKLHKEEDKYIEAQPRCTCFPPSATSVQCWWGGRQVHRGAAEMYLSFLRINIALESGGHRVQLQSIVDEEEASTTRRSRVVLVLLPNQQCWGVGSGLPSATPAQWRNSWFFSRNLFVPADCHPHPYLALKRWT